MQEPTGYTASKQYIVESDLVLPMFCEDGAEFRALHIEIQKATASDWLICRQRGWMHGRGLIDHYNWIMFCIHEDQATAEKATCHGVLLNGRPIYRDDY